MATPFKLKSGNASAFKNLGSSPAKQHLPKDFNVKGSKGSTTPGYSTTKAAKTQNFIDLANKTKTVSSKTNVGNKVKQLVKKGAKKVGKFVGGKALGVAGMMMATSATADQPTEKQGKKGSYTDDFTKLK